MAQPATAIDIEAANPAHAARLMIRAGEFTGHTAGLAPGYVQGNLCILPADYAAEFAEYCRNNPKPCPLLASGAAGDPHLPTLADDLDIRSDLPRYRVFRDLWGVRTLLVAREALQDPPNPEFYQFRFEP